jgi:hypothetical protein
MLVKGHKTYYVDKKAFLNSSLVYWAPFPCSWIRIHISDTDMYPAEPY